MSKIIGNPWRRNADCRLPRVDVGGEEEQLVNGHGVASGSNPRVAQIKSNSGRRRERGGEGSTGKEVREA